MSYHILEYYAQGFLQMLNHSVSESTECQCLPLSSSFGIAFLFFFLGYQLQIEKTYSHVNFFIDRLLFVGLFNI